MTYRTRTLTAVAVAAAILFAPNPAAADQPDEPPRRLVMTARHYYDTDTRENPVGTRTVTLVGRPRGFMKAICPTRVPRQPRTVVTTSGHTRTGHVCRLGERTHHIKWITHQLDLSGNPQPVQSASVLTRRQHKAGQPWLDPTADTFHIVSTRPLDRYCRDLGGNPWGHGFITGTNGISYRGYHCSGLTPSV